MRVRQVLSVVRVECRKIGAQFTARAVLAACVAAPLAFVAVMRVQNNLPDDTLFGRAVKETGFATPLVVLGFAGLWALPALSSVIGGDLFSAEDRHGTWGTVLARGCSRGDLFAGKVLTAMGFSTVAVVTLAVSSVGAGVLAIGAQPLIDLSGSIQTSAQALRLVLLAWTSVLPPVFAFTALAVLLSVATRSSVAGVGAPVLAGLLLRLGAFADGPEWARRLLIVSAFDAWHGLLNSHPYYGSIAAGSGISGACILICLVLAYALLQRRDIGNDR